MITDYGVDSDFEYGINICHMYAVICTIVNNYEPNFIIDSMENKKIFFYVAALVQAKGNQAKFTIQSLRIAERTAAMLDTLDDATDVIVERSPAYHMNVQGQYAYASYLNIEQAYSPSACKVGIAPKTS